MIRKFIMMGMAIVSLNSCAQKKNNSKVSHQVSYAPMDFVKNNGDLKYSADSDGLIYFRCYYGHSDGSENPHGKAWVYMIHKNGGKWWYDKAKELYPDKHFPHNFFGNRLYETKDSLTLKDYYKWAFFIDKQYLKPETSGGGKRTWSLPAISLPIPIRSYCTSKSPVPTSGWRLTGKHSFRKRKKMMKIVNGSVVFISKNSKNLMRIIKSESWFLPSRDS